MIEYKDYADGMIIYIAGKSSEETLNRVAEIRFYNENEVNYSAELFGNFLPVYKIRTGSVDRLFIHMPPSYVYTCVPLMINTIPYSRLLFSYETFYYWIDAFHPQHLFVRNGNEYFIDQTGFNIVNSTIFIDSTEFPVKHKIFINNSDFSATFRMIDPVSKLLKWTVVFSSKEITINGVSKGTFEFSDGIEIDFGYSQNNLQITINTNEVTPIKVTDSSPIDEATTVDDTNLEIDGVSLEFKWWFCYRSAADECVVCGSTPYVDVFDLMTTGAPKLVSRHYYSIKGIMSEQHQLDASCKIAVGELTNTFNLALVCKILEGHIYDYALEHNLIWDKELVAGTSLKLFQVVETEYGVLNGLSELVLDIENEIKTSRAGSDMDLELSIKSVIEQHIDKRFASKIAAWHFSEEFLQMKSTVMHAIVEIVSLQILTNKELSDSAFDVLRYIVEKSSLAVEVECQMITKTYVFVENKSIEVS